MQLALHLLICCSPHREQGGWQDAAAAAQREAQLLRGQAAATAASLALLGAELAALKGERGRLLEAAAAQRAQATALEQVGVLATACDVTCLDPHI